MVDISEQFNVFDRVTDAFFAVLTYIHNEATKLLFRAQTDLIGKIYGMNFEKTRT